MARKLQKLINYHTSGTSMPASGDVALGEIVVRHNDEKPELLIKKNDGSFATFIDSGAVENAIAVNKTTLDGQITALSNSVTAFSAHVETAYATKDDAQGYATAAKNEAKADAVASAKSYTDGKASELSTNISNVDTKVTTLSNSVTAFSAHVETAYATKDDAQGYATAAKNEAKADAVASAKSYTDGKASALNTNIGNVDAKVTTLIGSDSGKSARSIAIDEISKVVSGAPESFDTLKEIADWIGTASGISAATLVADIEALKKADSTLSTNIGNVDAKVTTLSNSVTAFSAHVETAYATKDDAQGYATAAKNEAKADAVASAKSYTDGKASELSTNISNVDTKVTTLSNSVTAFSAHVETAYATKDDAQGYATAAKNEAKADAVASAKSYTDGKASALNTSITGLDTRITALENLSGATASAIQEIKVSGITGVDVVENGTTRTLDFTDMVIDCGDF